MAQVPEIISALEVELNAIERLMPPKNQAAGPEFDAHLEAIDPARLLQLLAYAMIDGRGDLHHVMRVSSRVRWGGIPLSIANATFAALADRLDGEILKRARTTREAREMVYVICPEERGGPTPLWSNDQADNWAFEIVEEVIAPMEEAELFEMTGQAALFDRFISGCEGSLCEGAMRIFFNLVGESNHARLEHFARMQRLMSYLGSAVQEA
jgi:hypothetical protein